MTTRAVRPPDDDAAAAEDQDQGRLAISIAAWQPTLT